MKSRNILIDSDSLSTVVSRMSSSAQSISDGADRSESGFAFLQSSDKLSSGINKIIKNLRTVSQRVSSYKDVFSRQGEAFFEQEKLFSAMADQIEIPTELTTVDNIFEVKTKDVTLNKEDGKTIKSDNDSSVTNFDEVKNVTRDDLKSIVKNDEVGQAEYDGQYNEEKVDLEKIVKTMVDDKAQINDSSSIDKVNLSQMKTNEAEQTTVAPEYTDRTVSLSNINKGDTSQVELHQRSYDNSRLLQSIMQNKKITNQGIGGHNDN